MGGSVNCGGGQASDIVWEADESHEVIDKPFGGDGTSRTVFQRHDGIKIISQAQNPALFVESSERDIQAAFLDTKFYLRFFSGEGIDSRPL